eukprot:10398359-Heterocapsa_arctica.AAC.1
MFGPLDERLRGGIQGNPSCMIPDVRTHGMYPPMSAFVIMYAAKGFESPHDQHHCPPGGHVVLAWTPCVQ